MPRPRPRTLIDPDSAGLWGLDEIARYLGCNYNTAKSWIERLGLPAFKLPNGRYYTTKDAISTWVMAGADVEREHPRKGLIHPRSRNFRRDKTARLEAAGHDDG